MKNKFGIFALACAVTAASGFSVCAEEPLTAPADKVFEVQAEFNLPALDITFPTSVCAVINPYRLNVEQDGVTWGNSGITSPEYEIVNNSPDIGIEINTKLFAIGSSVVDIVSVDEATGSAPLFRNDGTENKQVFAYLNTTLIKGIYANSEYIVGDSAQLAFSESIPEKYVKLMRIEPMSAGFFRIQGSVVEEPAVKWSTGDSVTFNIIFDITPYNHLTDETGSAPPAAE